MILFSTSDDAPSKFVQIYLLTFLQNTARLTRRISSQMIALFLTWIEHLLRLYRNYISPCKRCRKIGRKWIQLFCMKMQSLFFRTTLCIILSRSHIDIQYIIYHLLSMFYTECVITVDNILIMYSLEIKIKNSKFKKCNKISQSLIICDNLNNRV